jgi:hypothetical protein
MMPPTPMMGNFLPSAARSWRITRLLASSTGAPLRPPASSACGKPLTARGQRGVGGDHAVHAVALQRGGDDLHLGSSRSGAIFTKMGTRLPCCFCQNLAALRDGAQQGVQRFVALQRAQVLGVGAGDVDSDIVGMRVDAVQADQVVAVASSIGVAAFLPMFRPSSMGGLRLRASGSAERCTLATKASSPSLLKPRRLISARPWAAGTCVAWGCRVAPSA